MWFSNRLSVISPLLLLSSTLTSAFYLPGVAPTSYDKGQKVPLNVNHLTPAISTEDDQLHSVFSYDYYHPAFRFCRPKDGPEEVRESLGSIIFGDRIRTSPFELHMAKNETCKPLCDEVKFDSRSGVFVNRRIWQGYNINWLIDGLPAAQLNLDPMTQTEFYSPGFLLGSLNEGGETMLHNHYDIIIDYHIVGMGKKEEYRVVGVLVQPESRGDSKNIEEGQADCGEGGPPMLLSEESETSVTWTYSVYWRESPTAWATRWDKYLHVFDPKIHWFSLINSAVFVVFLVGMVSMILLRALRKDIARYNRLDSINLDDLNDTSASVEDGIQEDSGWKLVHGDVFRSPSRPLVLSVFLGSGAQLFVMTGVTVGKFLTIIRRVFKDIDMLIPYSLRTIGSPLPIEPRISGYHHPPSLYCTRVYRRIRLGAGVQDVRRRSMETQYRPHSFTDPWNCICRVLPAQLLLVDQTV